MVYCCLVMKMKIGFRKSLFGFKPDDVLAYIEKTQKAFSDKEAAFSKQLEELREELTLSAESYEKLEAEKNEIAAKLAEFNEKYEEIGRLSENIGKLYLVAQANAQAIMASSEESADLADSEIEKNLSAIHEAHTSLDGLKQNMLSASNDFIREVDSLIASLDETRRQIEDNTSKNADRKKNFDTIYENLIQ